MYENPPEPSAPPKEEVLNNFDYALQFLGAFQNVFIAAGKMCLYAIVAACIISFLFLNVLVAVFLVNTMCASSQKVSQWDECLAISDVSLKSVYVDGNMLSETFELIYVQSLKLWYNDLNGKNVCEWFVPKMK